MNIDTLNSKYKVVSKYFASKTVMDESLSDFKEKKSFHTKSSKAPAKPKVKKVKRAKGQKDIRTVLKAKNNELIAYSKDFDSICKKSGIDVDSEQLQLAIALSKSLQKDSDETPSSSCKSLTSQQRSGLIRTTLKEYGFKVPEKPNASRKTKKRTRPYKLLLTSEEEKHQIISDRYSQLLFELNSLKTTNCVQNLDLSNLFIYNMATNVDYETIKDDSVYYVENIVEKSPNNMGCLLKNWSDIPGRISSPVANKSELLFSEVECSQEELDIVLSGSLKNSKDMLKKKSMLKDRGKNIDLCFVKKSINVTIEQTPILIEDNIDSHHSPAFLTGSCSHDRNYSDKSNESLIEVHKREEINLAVGIQPSRSLSPDLFDDEDDSVVEIPNKTMTENESEHSINITKQATEVMDLTECVNLKFQKTMYDSNTKLLSQADVTKRKSNDFMEITECVGISSQILLNMLPKINKEIDLTGCSVNVGSSEGTITTVVENDEVIESVDESSQPAVKDINEHIDLTAEFESNSGTHANIPCNEKNSSTSVVLEARTDEHIDLTGLCADMVTINNNLNADNIEHMDLTQSSNSSNDTLPFVHIGGTQAITEKDQDDTIILNENDYLNADSSVVNKDLDASYKEQLNQDLNSTKSAVNAINITSPKHISEETDEVPVISLDETCEVPEVNDENVDLTQTSDSNEAIHVSNNQINNSSLGRKDNVSVDYDEALENMNSFPYYDNENYDNDTIVTEEPLDISNDKEKLSNTNNDLNSFPKNVDNFEFGGISVIDNLSCFNSKSRMSLPNNGISMRDSLPMVNVKGTHSSNRKSPTNLIGVTNPMDIDNFSAKPNGGTHTPQTKGKRNITVETPKQSEYIVKTDNVTPMLDYASMSTPERNRELDKYGLKPFKRKRAIQLLTHLYNQTHPYVESTEELPSPSPSKKRKTENLSQPSSSPRESTKSPKKASKPYRKTSRSPVISALSQRNTSKSPVKTPSSQRNTSRSPVKTSISQRNTSSSPRKTSRSPHSAVDGSNDSDKENNLFMVTREVPVIRNLECDAEDWVFQKREKAKLHSCRVPLHIAFHNLVSCRRGLHEAILRYEPVNIDIVHKELTASGHRYHPKDLLKFLDKRCITVKTADNTKNNKRY